MAITSDKVLSAASVARYDKMVDPFEFDNISQNGFFVVLGETRILQFSTNQQANDTKNLLNSAISSIKTQLHADYLQEEDDILNA